MRRYGNLRNYETLKKIQKDGKEDWAFAFQKAVDENRIIYIPRGKYYIGSSVTLPSNCYIRAARSAEIVLPAGMKTLMLRNKSVIDGSKCAVDLGEAHEKNITIEGGYWAEENVKRLGCGASGAFDENNSLVGVSTCMLFSGVKNLKLKNMRFGYTAGFSVQIGRCENIKIENIHFVNCFADGIHINGFVKNVFIKNLSGDVGDDLVALNAYDWEDSTINNGPIENICIENIRATLSRGYKAFRVLAGIVPTESGEINCYIKNLHIKQIEGISAFKMYLQTPAYKDKPDGTKVGRLENVTIEDVNLTLNESVDSMENYRNCDVLTGHAGAFELGDNISKLTLKNITAKINKEQYPTLHFITVGPKSSYIKNRGIEIFDPYATSVVDEIVYQNINVNGRRIEDLRTEIKEVSFPDDMYEGQYGRGGLGKVKKITKIK